MRAVVHPGLLRGEVRAIESKSDAHRQLICAALSDGPTELALGALSEDIEATWRCLEALGAEIEHTGAGLLVRPIRARGQAVLDCGESGSTLRFLLPLAPALGIPAHFTARGRLTERPNAALLAQLRSHGAQIDGETPPLSVGGRLTGGLYLPPGDVSSQFATGLLFALPLLDAPSEIRFTTPVESQGYIDLTVSVLTRYGIRIDKAERGYTVPAPQRYRSPGRAELEGDWSNAAFWLAADALGGDVRVTGLNPDSKQADRAMPGLLERLTADGDALIDAAGAPDLVPILAAVATQAPGETRIVNAARLRIKESDRLSAMRENLSALGADVRELPDGLIIRGGRRLTGGETQSFNDHRIAMAMAIAATVADGPVVIEGAEAVNKSYPKFFEDFQALGGWVDVEHIRD